MFIVSTQPGSIFLIKKPPCASDVKVWERTLTWPKLIGKWTIVSQASFPVLPHSWLPAC